MNRIAELTKTFECGCCYCEYDETMLIKCRAGHKFCRTCIRSASSALLVQQKYKFPCCSTDGCTEFFSQAETRKFIHPKSLGLWLELQDEASIQQLQKDGVDVCCFCGNRQHCYDQNTEFMICNNTYCGGSMCRKCREEEHRGKTCAGMSSLIISNLRNILI